MNTGSLLINAKAFSFMKILTVNISKLAVYFPFALFVILTLLWIVVAYKMGDWRNWKLYYPTILFFWCGDLVYNVVFYKNPLWLFINPIFSHLLTDFLCAAIVFTCTVLVFLPKYPEGLVNQAKYLALWVFIYSGVEGIFFVIKGISYSNGWNLGHSIIHNIYQFILLRIHHKNPILAWILALAIMIVTAKVFGVSLDTNR